MSGQLQPHHLHAVPSAAPRELTGELACDVFPLIPAGAYTAAYAGAEDVEQYEGWRRYLWFRLVAMDHGQEPYDGVRLPLICRMLSKGRFRPRSKYVLLWTRLAGRRPQRIDRLSTAVFRGRLFSVRVRTVVVDHNQRPLDEVNHYSIIHDIIRVEVGGPRG